MQLWLDSSLNVAQGASQEPAQVQHLLQSLSSCDCIESICTMPVLDSVLMLTL